MLSFVLPFRTDQLFLEDVVHRKQLHLLRHLPSSELEAMSTRGDFLEMLVSFFANPQKKFYLQIIDILKKISLPWPLCVDALGFLASADAKALEQVWMERYRVLFSETLNVIGKKLLPNLLQGQFQGEFDRMAFLLDRLHRADPTSIRCEHHPKILMQSFPGLTLQQAEASLEANHWRIPEAQEWIREKHPEIVDSETQWQLREATLRAVERLAEEEEILWDEERLPETPDPSQWKSIAQVPAEALPLLSIFLHSRQILTITHRRHRARVEAERALKISAEHVEGWAAVFSRNPRCDLILHAFSQKFPHLASLSNK